MLEITYAPSRAVVAFSTTPPPWGYAHTHMLPMSAPLSAALTVPEMVVLDAIAALTPVAGDATEVETTRAADSEDAPAAVLLNH
jgi:hypothetical protein